MDHGRFESIYSRFKVERTVSYGFCSNECIRPKRFYEWRSKLLRKGGFIPVKVNSKGQVSLPHKEKSLLSALRSARRQFPSRYVRSPYPNGVTVRLNSPLSPEVLQTLIFFEFKPLAYVFL